LSVIVNRITATGDGRTEEWRRGEGGRQKRRGKGRGGEMGECLTLGIPTVVDVAGIIIRNDLSSD